MSRILNRQRQMAEQGRLRLGYTVAGEKGPRPVRSQTWVLTSHSEEHITTAAQLWGGDVERWQPMGNGHEQWRVITQANSIDAILPPGDPLTQAYEQWSKGGCQVRCDGVTEQFSGSPCLCLAKFGEQWYERNTGVCDSKSRLKVMLPDMPGLGVWRMETGSFYATDEIAGMVDTIRAAVGPTVLVPVRLRIEQRTRVAGGQTKQFVVPVLDIRGVTAGSLLAGEVPGAKAVGGQPDRKAIEPGPTGNDSGEPRLPTLADIKAADTRDAVVNIWRFLKNHDALTDDLDAACADRVAELQTANQPPPPQTQRSEEAVWQDILARAGELGWGETQLHEEFTKANGGVMASAASAGEMEAFLEHLRKEPAF